MPGPEFLFWGLTWANLIAFGGIIGNFAFTWVKDRKTRAVARELDAYNHIVRTPVEKQLDDLTALMDDADDAARATTWADGLEAAKALEKKFHNTRRKLARALTDCDTSARVRGEYWSDLEGDDMDFASGHISKAARANSMESFRQELIKFAQCIDGFRQRVREALDRYADSLS